MTERFKIGDTVWAAYAGSTSINRPCRVCAGTRRVTLVLGSGEHVGLDCDYCGRGFEGPQGVESAYEYRSEPMSFHITGIDIAQTEHGEVVTYREGTDGAWRSIEHGRCHASYEGARAAGEALVAQHEREQEERMQRKEKSENKSYGWHAGYHLREAKRARESAEYHERKAVIMRAKSKVASETSP